ncbi:MAG: GIY-YIG nuclease family protein [Bdellovibrionales bacterium]
MKRGGYFYILANQRNGTLYKGVTNDLIRRVSEHKEGKIKGFSQRYCIKTLVYYEGYDDIRAAIAREKQVGEWKRAWKLKLIEDTNPEWRDLYSEMIK